MPVSSAYVRWSSAAPTCSAVGVSGAPFAPPHDVAFGKAVVASCTLSRSPCTFSIDSRSPTNTSSLRTTLTFGPTGGGSAPKPLATPALVQAKRDALDALRSSLPSAVYPCLVAAGGTSLLAAPLALLPGAVLVALSAPLCASWAKAIGEWARTVADPTAAAIRTTVERDGAGKKAGNKDAVAKQEQTLTRLKRELATATAARRRAGAALAATLRETKASIKLTRAQVAEGLEVVKARVGRSGLGAAKLSALGGPALTPRPIDALATLGA